MKADVDRWVRELRAAGHRPNVVARRLIVEHGLDRAAACLVVQRIYETDTAISPYAGETFTKVVVALGLMVIGGGIAVLPFIWGVRSVTLLLTGGITLARGMERLIVALVNHGVEEP